jgi:hypothetical protein
LGLLTLPFQAYFEVGFGPHFSDYYSVITLESQTEFHICLIWRICRVYDLGDDGIGHGLSVLIASSKD